MLPSFKRVDTCAAEFAAETPYLYSSYDGSDESRPSSAKKVLPLSGRWRTRGDMHCAHPEMQGLGARLPVRLHDDPK